MWHHFVNLLWHSVAMTSSALGYKPLGVAVTIVAFLLDLVLTLYLLFRNLGREEMKRQWTQGIKYAALSTACIGIFVMIVAWLAGIIATVYEDHQSLVAANNELRDKREAIGFTFNYQDDLEPPEKRPGFIDKDTHQSNWAVMFTVTSGKPRRNSCIDVVEVKGPNQLHIVTPRRLGWAGGTESFTTCPTIFGPLKWNMFTGQVYKSGREKLQLFVAPGDAHYDQLRDDMPVGTYTIKVRFIADDTQPQFMTFQVTWSGHMRDSSGVTLFQMECLPS